MGHQVDSESVDIPTSETISESSLDSLEGIEQGSLLITGLSKKLGDGSLLKGLSKKALSKFSRNSNKGKLRKRYMEPENRKHRDKLKGRTSYVSPSREGLVPLIAHVPEELRAAIKEKADHSGVTLNEFLTALYRNILADPAKDSSPSVAEVLKKTSELQKIVNNLAADLSSRSNSR